MSIKTVGELRQVHYTVMRSLNFFGPKGEFTHESFGQRFSAVINAILQEQGQSGEDSFWRIPDDVLLGPKADGLVCELLFWISKVRMQ